jgi:bifunctional DNA-binding transcriptional regulator/antitoxin component of YhaV-PrlF toxin-antitoxin module
VRAEAGTLPDDVRQHAGIKIGDMLEFKADEYTPDQRRIIDARLDEAEAEIKQGHVSPAFDTIEEFADAIKADARKLRVKTKRLPRR